jgi:hypothetical protein
MPRTQRTLKDAGSRCRQAWGLMSIGRGAIRADVDAVRLRVCRLGRDDRRDPAAVIRLTAAGPGMLR